MVPPIFGVEFKQVMYIVGGIFITVVAIASSTLLYYYRKKIIADRLATGMSTKKNSKEARVLAQHRGRSEASLAIGAQSGIKAQLEDLEKQRKDIESELGDGTRKQSVVSVKHRAASIARDVSGTAKIVKASKKTTSKIEDSKVEIVEDQDTDIKPFDAVRTGKSKFSVKYWRAHLLERMNPETTALISMELLNGFHRLFIVKEKDEGFQYRGKKYLFDNEAKYYIIDTKLWCYDFHENFTLPIKRKIPLTHIKKSIEHSNISEVEYATNPSTLERFTISKIAEGIMKGQAIDEFMKQIRLLLIIAMVTAVIHLALFMFKSGMLQSIKIPGVTS